MTELIVIIVAAVLTSAMCSLFEAVLYAVPQSLVETLASDNNKSGLILKSLRRDVERPISAILALNTFANAAGATFAGAAVAKVFGHEWLAAFSAGFTVVILMFSEILPKTYGVVHSRTLAPFIARPLNMLVVALTPLVWVCQLAAKIVKPEGAHQPVSEGELINMAADGVKSGTLAVDQASVIQNMFNLESKTVASIMTHRSVLVDIQASMLVSEAMQMADILAHSRIPVYGTDRDDITGILYRRDLLQMAADDQHQLSVSDMAKPANFILRTLPVDQALHFFLNGHNKDLFLVVDNHGSVDGVLSLEDVLEEILGKEIEDDFGSDGSKQQLAQTRRQQVMEKVLRADKSHLAPAANPDQ